MVKEPSSGRNPQSPLPPVTKPPTSTNATLPPGTKSPPLPPKPPQPKVSTKKDTNRQKKVLLVGDSISGNIDTDVIEKALNAKVKGVKAYASIFDNVGNVAKEPARYPAKNFTNIIAAEVKKEHFDFMVIQSGSVDITNLKTKDRPAEYSSYFKQEVVFAARNLFSVAVAALESQPSLQKIVIMNQTPRFDESVTDPMALKPALAQLFNNTLAESWLDYPKKENIVIGIHNLECSGGVKEARYRNLKYNRYDGVHLYGPSGRKAYTISVLDILKTAGLCDANQQIQSGQEYFTNEMNWQYQTRRKNTKIQHRDEVNDRDVRNQRYNNERYSVPTYNMFSHLN